MVQWQQRNQQGLNLISIASAWKLLWCCWCWWQSCPCCWLLAAVDPMTKPFSTRGRWWAATGENRQEWPAREPDDGNWWRWQPPTWCLCLLKLLKLIIFCVRLDAPWTWINPMVQWFPRSLPNRSTRSVNADRWPSGDLRYANRYAGKYTICSWSQVKPAIPRKYWDWVIGICPRGACMSTLKWECMRRWAWCLASIASIGAGESDRAWEGPWPEVQISTVDMGEECGHSATDSHVFLGVWMGRKRIRSRESSCGPAVMMDSFPWSGLRMRRGLSWVWEKRKTWAAAAIRFLTVLRFGS